MHDLPEELIPTRATLLLRLKDWHDHSSWQDFFDTYWNLIYGIAVKSGLKPEEAQDVVQETMLYVAKKIPDFKYNPAQGSFKGWLLNITRWRINDQYRKNKSGKTVDKPVDGETSSEPVMEEAAANPELAKLWDQEWENNLLTAAITKARRRLDPQQYQIFDFYVHKGWAPERISKTFGIPVAQIYLIKHRVTEAIREEVDRLKRDLI